MTGRRLGAARGAAALAGIVALLLGPPIALGVSVGWPLPRSWPSASGIEQTLRLGIPDEALVKTLAVVVWLAWAQLAIALVAEVIATARGRPTRRLPLMPGMQQAAARLVAGVLMMAGTLHPSATAAPSPPPVHPTPVVQIDPVPVVTAGEPMADGAPTTWRGQDGHASPVAAPTITVERHDSFWSIAEQTLGDPLRWVEIRDLNIGRTMSDGHVMSATSDLLRPGWTLLLPPDARLSPQAPPASGPAEVVVTPGEHLWSIAAERVEADLGRPPTDGEIARYWGTLVDANDDRLAEPDLVHAGQSLAAPPTPYAPVAPAQPPPPPPVESDDPPPAPAAATEDDPDATEQAPADGSVARPAHPSVPSRSADGASGVPVAPIVVGGLASAALAVGVARAVRFRRRRYTASHPGRAARSTAVGDQPLHRQVLAHGDEDAIDQLDAALRHLASALTRVGARCRPRIVQHSDHHLDVLLDGPAPQPPPGWTTSTDPQVWSLDRSIPLPGGEMAAPMLVVLGRSDADGQLYLDLEAEGLVSVTGDDGASRDLARSIAMELLLRSTLDTPEVIVVGDLLDPVAAETFDHVTVGGDWAEVAADVVDWIAQTHGALEENGWGNAFIGRATDAGADVLAPLVVVATDAPPPSVLDALAVHRPSTVAVVSLGTIGAAATIIECREGTVAIPELGLRCPAQGLEDQAATDLARLVRDAEQPELPWDDAAMVEFSSAEVDGQGQIDEEPEYDILVRLLGDITVEGGRKSLPPKPTAVVAYVALHRSVSSEQLQDACWSEPGLTDHRRRLRDLMSQCRASVGTSHLPTSSDGRYSAGPRLVTDVELFERRVTRAASLPPTEAASAYRDALALVSGKVFSYPSRARSSYTWIDTENLVNRWEVRIAGVAQQCAETYIDMGDPDAAVEVLHSLAAALPLHSGLAEALMRAHAAVGNLQAVRSTYAAYVNGLDDLDLDVEDSIQTTYDDLVARERAASR